jgi:diketogulonate reductase-like aldo/keto reductase
MATASGPRQIVSLPHGEDMAPLGLGTWRMGESAAHRAAEVSALRLSFEIGYRLIDTAEMYGDGGAESVVGAALREAIRSGIARESFFIVSKVLPDHADTAGVVAACEASLRRLGVDHLDLYLLHWRGRVPLKDTVDAFEILQRRGWIRHWGVSNFDTADMRDLFQAPGGTACSANQVWYSLSQRGVELDLLPWQRVHDIPLMAYCPIDQGSLVDHPGLRAIAQRHGATPAQVALAWLMTKPGVVPIPKAVHAVHLRHNWQATRLQLTEQDVADLDLHFPPPRRKTPLAMR